jgi:hypothetical protein
MLLEQEFKETEKMLDDMEFKTFVIEKLSSIDERLSSLESGLDGLSGFASGITEGLEIDQGSMQQLRETLSALATPSVAGMASANPSMSSEDIMSSLSEFRDRLAGIRGFMESQGLSESESSD